MSELYKSYKISEKDFIKDKYDELICEYNGYRIEISYIDEYLYWCADAFDLEAEQYVFYPCLSVPDRDKTQLNDVIQQVAKYIDEKIKSKSRGNKDILIYIKNMKHTYTEEQKEQIAQMLYDFLVEHNCFGGEHFAQDDSCQIDSIDFMCDLADIKDVTED